MSDSSRDTKLQAFLTVGHTSQEAPLCIVVERTTQGIADFVGEGCDTRHFGDVCLDTQLLGRQSTLTCTPTFAIDKDGGIDGIDGLADFVHCLDIMTTHQVEAEAVDMVFVDPMLHRLNHELPHHRLVGSSLVATAGAVGIFTIHLSIIIVGVGALEVGVVDVVGMVVDHIEDDGDASLVKSLHHLLELTNTARGIIWIGRIATLWHVVVHRIIAPVVLWGIKAGLIHRAIIIAGQDMNGIHTQCL